MPRKEPIEQRGPSAADMQKACGRGGKTDDDGHSRRMEKAREISMVGQFVVAKHLAQAGFH